MTYADDFNIRNPSVVKWNDVGNAVDGLLIATYDTSTVSTQNTTSTSFTDMTPTLSVTVADGEKVFIIGAIGGSMSAANIGMSIKLRRDSTDISTSTSDAFAHRTNTVGVDFYIVNWAIDAPAAGTYTYKLRWAVDSGTGYSGKQKITALVFQNS